jgi:hypothetical protein
VRNFRTWMTIKIRKFAVINMKICHWKIYSCEFCWWAFSCAFMSWISLYKFGFISSLICRSMTSTTRGSVGLSHDHVHISPHTYTHFALMNLNKC